MSCDDNNVNVKFNYWSKFRNEGAEIFHHRLETENNFIIELHCPHLFCKRIFSATQDVYNVYIQCLDYTFTFYNLSLQRNINYKAE